MTLLAFAFTFAVVMGLLLLVATPLEIACRISPDFAAWLDRLGDRWV